MTYGGLQVDSKHLIHSWTQTEKTAIKQAELKLHSWQYSLICFLPWVIREEQKIEVVRVLNADLLNERHFNSSFTIKQFVQEKRKESVEYLHQVNVRYQDRGLLFDLR